MQQVVERAAATAFGTFGTLELAQTKKIRLFWFPAIPRVGAIISDLSY